MRQVRPAEQAMLNRRALLQAAMAAAATWATSAVAAPQHMKWIAYYGQTADVATLAGYDLVILDPGFRGSIPAVKEAGARVCAYLSLGETRQTDLYKQIDDAALLAQNPTWNTRQIDVRHPSYRDTVVNKMIPAIVAQGFAGLMVDTLDTPPYLEQLSQRNFGGMTQAAVDLVRTIRETYPHLKLIMNRGNVLLPHVIDSIDAVIAESLLTRDSGIETAIPGGGGYVWNKPHSVAEQLSLLMPARDRNLPVLSLDYWEPTDDKTIAQLYLRERLLSHHPYVATALLNEIIPEPPLASTPVRGL